MKYRTKQEAAQAWVGEFDAIDTQMIEKLMKYEPDDWNEIYMDEDVYTLLPIWGTMWRMHDPCDDYWIEETPEGCQALKRCGFRIYQSEQFGIYFGIDGCGYDFYESHWIPLYKERGLHWHEDEDENEVDMPKKKGCR